MVVEEYILPAWWAGALINDDRTDFTDEEEAQLDAFLSKIGPAYCVGHTDEEAYFSHRNDAGTLADEVMVFVFHKEEEDGPEYEANKDLEYWE